MFCTRICKHEWTIYIYMCLCLQYMNTDIDVYIYIYIMYSQTLKFIMFGTSTLMLDCVLRCPVYNIRLCGGVLWGDAYDFQPRQKISDLSQSQLLRAVTPWFDLWLQLKPRRRIENTNFERVQEVNCVPYVFLMYPYEYVCILCGYIRNAIWRRLSFRWYAWNQVVKQEKKCVVCWSSLMSMCLSWGDQDWTKSGICGAAWPVFRDGCVTLLEDSPTANHNCLLWIGQPPSGPLDNEVCSMWLNMSHHASWHFVMSRILADLLGPCQQCHEQLECVWLPGGLSCLSFHDQLSDDVIRVCSKRRPVIVFTWKGHGSPN